MFNDIEERMAQQVAGGVGNAFQLPLMNDGYSNHLNHLNHLNHHSGGAGQHTTQHQIGASAASASATAAAGVYEDESIARQKRIYQEKKNLLQDSLRELEKAKESINIDVAQTRELMLQLNRVEEEVLTAEANYASLRCFRSEEPPVYHNHNHNQDEQSFEEKETPFHELRDPSHLIASSLPPDFPAELSFRALGCYSLLRTLSRHLRLSPFTPHSFLRGLILPVPNQLLGEVHVAVLRHLFASVRYGNYHVHGHVVKDLANQKKRGGNNISYMNSLTWTLFFEDYVEMTVEKFIDIDKIVLDARRFMINVRGKDGTDLLDKRPTRTKKKVNYNEDQDEAMSMALSMSMGVATNNTMNINVAPDVKPSLSSFNNVLDVSKSSENVLVKVPQPEMEKVKKPELKPEPEPEGPPITLPVQSEKHITMLLQAREFLRSKEIATADGAEVNQSSSSNIHDTTTSTANNTPVAVGTVAGSLQQPGTTTTTNPAPMKRKRGRPPKNSKTTGASASSSSSVKSKATPGKRRGPGRPKKKASTPTNNNNSNVKSSTDHSYPKRKKQKESNSSNSALAPLDESTTTTTTAAAATEDAVISESNLLQLAFQQFVSTPPDKQVTPHKSEDVQSRLMKIKDLIQVIAARTLHHGDSYYTLPIEIKLDILEFLLDELTSTEPVCNEFAMRQNITSSYIHKFGPLPSAHELEHSLENMDQCNVCGFEGDLICCDGCPASYHRHCVDIGEDEVLPDGPWLCPECRILDPARLGPLKAGSKSEIDWFTMKEFTNAIFPHKSNSNSNSSSSNNNNNNHLTTSNKNSSLLGTTNLLLAGPHHQSHHPVGGGIEGYNIGRDGLMTLSQTGAATSATRTNKSSENETEYMVVHGYVFKRNNYKSSQNNDDNNNTTTSTRNRNSTKQKAPQVLSSSEVYDLLLSIGPENGTQWPWCQIPFNPFLIWNTPQHQHHQQQDSSSSSPLLLEAFKKKQVSLYDYQKQKDCFNPTAYSNLYRKSSLPKTILNSSGVRTKKYFLRDTRNHLRYPVISSLLRSSNLDQEFLCKQAQSQSQTQTQIYPTLMNDPLNPCKIYLFSLEALLRQAYLLDVFWNTSTTKLVQNQWHKKLQNCSSVSKLIKLCVELVDSIHPRAFHEDWFKGFVTHGKLKGTVGTKSKTLEEAGGYYYLPKDWNDRKECKRRVWQRCQAQHCLSILSKEGYHFGGQSSSSRKNKGNHAYFSLSLFKPKGDSGVIRMKETVPRYSAYASIKKAEQQQQHDLLKKKRKTKMTSDLLSEEDMKEFDEDAEDSYDNEYSEPYLTRAEKGDHDDLAYQPSRRPQFSSSDQSSSNARKTRSSRRISSRSKAAAYEDKGILWPDGTPKYVYEHEKSMETSIVFERYHKLEALEKDMLRQIREKEAHWPMCGRKFFPPDGSLPKSALRKLARNSGTIFAPHLLYSDKYEVGQPSFSHFWRRKIQTCKSCEEVNLQLSILESFINRETIANIIQVSETALKKKYTVDKVIELSQHDPMTGLVEFFVKDSNKNTGCWMPQHAIENSMLIQFLHTETTKHQQDFLEKVNTTTKEGLTNNHLKENLEFEKRLVLEQVEESKKKMFLLKNSISVVEEGMYEKQKELDQNEESCLDLQKEVQRSKQEIEKLEDQHIKLRRAALQAQSAMSQHHHQHQTSSFHNPTSYNNNQTNNINNANNPFGHLVDHDTGRMDNMMNNFNNNHNNNHNSAALQEEESIYEDAFKSAVLAHRDATAALLKQSANIGLETVPADTISKERFKHMTEMKKANDKLLELGSTSHITEDELVNVLSDAESAGVQLYVNGAEDVAINNTTATQQQAQALSSLTNEDSHLNSRFMNGAAAAAKSNSHHNMARLNNAGAAHAADSLFEKQVLSQLAQLDPSLIQGSAEPATALGGGQVGGRLPPQAQQQLQQHFASHHAHAGLDNITNNNNAFATTLSSALALSEANKNAGGMNYQLDSPFSDPYSTAAANNQLLMQSVAQAASAGGTAHHGNQFGVGDSLNTTAADALMLGLTSHHHHHHAGNNAAHHVNAQLQNALGVGAGVNANHNPFASAASSMNQHHHHQLNHAAAQGQLFNQHSTQFPYNFTNSMNQGGVDQNRNFGDFGF